MIPLSEPDLSGNEARYLQECIETNFVSSVGPFVDRFESMAADSCGGAGAVATASGTTGLHVALTALGVGRDDLVILPSYTFIASANAIAHCGAQPWLIDVDEASWTLDAGCLEQALTDQTERVGGQLRHRASGRRVAAVLPVYTLGTPADMDAIGALARAHGLPVLVDAAAAIGARYRGRPLADVDADLSVLSFNGNKTLTSGGGGAVVSTRPELLARVRHLATTARVGAGYDYDEVGFNYRMTNLQAAVGCAQLERLDQAVAAKRRIAGTYGREWAELPGVEPFPDPGWAEPSCWLSGVRLRGRRAESLVPAMRARGVDARVFWKPVSQQQPYADCPAGSLLVTDSLWGEVLTLPCSITLGAQDQRTVIDALLACLSQAEPIA